eukprot:TRINITY_DN1928_c0_g1_i1.p1 TRINITY_DN1928_c0_g1~~TRINITY_DN1928_c0_g1_i1.p1  ORF type:complete len:367 (-),score=104.02 TRINITY_DN1928_c0_g1_i1:110-1210(-)
MEMDNVLQVAKQLLTKYVHFGEPSFIIAILFILGSPVGWNILGRLEYYTRCFTLLFRSKFRGCYAQAAYIFTFSAFRNYFFHLALLDQPTVEVSPTILSLFQAASIFCYVAGAILVASASWLLGIVGTYNGDYFHILMDERLTQFPFNVLRNPMYVGSTLLFLAQALWKVSPSGILLSLWVYTVYKTCCVLFEEPFTGYIYSQAALEAENERVLREAKIGLRNYSPVNTVEEVAQWIEKIGYGQYKENFLANHIDGSCLDLLDADLLKNDLGIASLGHRFKILVAIQDKIEEEERLKMNERKINKWLSERRQIEEQVVKVVDEVVLSQLKLRVNNAKQNMQKMVGKFGKPGVNLRLRARNQTKTKN